MDGLDCEREDAQQVITAVIRGLIAIGSAANYSCTNEMVDVIGKVLDIVETWF